MLGRGKLIENVVYDQIFNPLSITATGVLYNGVAATNTSYIDSQGYDELNIVLNKGAIAGTIDAAMYESDATDPSAATAVSGADFTQITSANQNAAESMSILCKNTKRYLWLRTNKTTDTNACVLGATAVLAKPDAAPTSESPVADV